jgi:hypothetical protein
VAQVQARGRIAQHLREEGALLLFQALLVALRERSLCLQFLRRGQQAGTQLRGASA